MRYMKCWNDKLHIGKIYYSLSFIFDILLPLYISHNDVLSSNFGIFVSISWIFHIVESITKSISCTQLNEKIYLILLSYQFSVHIKVGLLLLLLLLLLFLLLPLLLLIILLLFMLLLQLLLLLLLILLLLPKCTW